MNENNPFLQRNIVGSRIRGGEVNVSAPLPSMTAGAQGASLQARPDRQPTNVNYLYQTNFKFVIHRLPKFEYFIQSVNLPGYGASDVLEQPTRFVAAKHPHARVNFENLTMSFLVDEDLSNWREIYDWMRTIYLVKNHKDYNDDISAHFSDGTLMLLNSAMNANKEIRFRNLLPVNITGLQFDSAVNDIEPFTSEITFAYDYYEFV